MEATSSISSDDFIKYVPEEILVVIFSYLSVQALLAVSSSCKKWYSIVQKNDSLWNNLSEQSEMKKPFWIHLNWKEFYIYRCTSKPKIHFLLEVAGIDRFDEKYNQSLQIVFQPPFLDLKQWLLKVPQEQINKSCQAVVHLFACVQDECGLLELLKYFTNRELSEDPNALTKKKSSIANNLAANFFQTLCSEYLQKIFDLSVGTLNNQIAINLDDIDPSLPDPTVVHNTEEASLFLERLYNSVNLLPLPIRESLFYLYNQSLLVGSDVLTNITQWTMFRLVIPALILRAQHYESLGNVGLMLKCISLAKLLRDVVYQFRFQSPTIGGIKEEHVKKMKQYLFEISSLPKKQNKNFVFSMTLTKTEIRQKLNLILNHHSLLIEEEEQRNLVAPSSPNYTFKIFQRFQRKKK